MNNVLFDPTTKRITALLDYDWAAVTHPVHEFHTGFSDLSGSTHPENPKLQQAVLKSVFEDSNATFSDEEKVDWQVAKAWDSALAVRGVVRPSQIKGVEDLEKLRKLEELICPFMLSTDIILKRRTPEQILKMKQEAEVNLIELLNSLGA
jgi:aminoglycoside phosphotransferase (APT) family kinase protein